MAGGEHWERRGTLSPDNVLIELILVDLHIFCLVGEPSFYGIHPVTDLAAAVVFGLDQASPLFETQEPSAHRKLAMSTPSETGGNTPLKPALRSEDDGPLSPRAGPVKGMDISVR